MFNKILVAYDESPESGRALLTGIHLAKSLNAELRAVSVQEKLPLRTLDTSMRRCQEELSCYVSRLLTTTETCKPMRERPLSAKG
jgi:nucleotide-binding universal stress UspA family protein